MDEVHRLLVMLFDSQAELRLKGLQGCSSAVNDMLDIRDLQAYIAWLILEDPDPEVRAEAVRATATRAAMGPDIGYAVPALLQLEADPSTPPELLEEVKRALDDAEYRRPFREILSEVE